MTGREWKPGDVAMVRYVDGGVEPSLLTYRNGWVSMVDGRGDGKDEPCVPIRPLVVIDPEDREQVERIRESLERMSFSTWACGATSCLQGALREFADPKPPRPDEPTGLGAVIEDTDGVLWTRTEHKPNLTGTVWVSAFHRTQADSSVMREYADIAAVRVLSEGVAP